MRILTLTTLYPNAAAPHHGVFVENRMRAFAGRSGADVRVVAPTPWFPAALPFARRYAAFARAPAEETRHGLSVAHPRYLVLPKIGMTLAAKTLARAFLREAEALVDSGWRFDVVDAHYFYPDGVAAAAVARRFGKPLVVTARGTDVNYIPRFPRQRRMILDAARRADAIVAVAQALKTEMIGFGVEAEKIRVLRNGVDLAAFRPLDREALRRAAGLEGPVLASVGHLVERKGHHLVVEALADLPDATLLVAGDGEERARLEALARRLGVARRTRFLGRIPHERLAEIYGMADALVLASSREGWPNVLLESMACGTPVAATDVWGSGEVVSAPEAGVLVPERSAPAIAAAVRRLLSAPPTRAATRAFAERFSWDETSDALAQTFADVVRARTGRSAPAAAAPRAAARPRMIVTVDTEEEFDWDLAETAAHAVCDPADIARFQTLAADAGARPLYFLTWPVIRDARAAAFFRELARAGAADLGAHLHQWVTPPLQGRVTEETSWQCNLPVETQRAKLVSLSEAFAAAFGRPAIAHRAGRYGVDAGSYAAIAAAGFTFDFSPSPGFDYSASGGPDFSGMSSAPFTMAVDGRCVYVTPVSGGRALRGGASFSPAPRVAAGFAPPRKSVADGLFAPMRLTCEGTRLDDLKALTRRLVADDTPVLTFSLHSTTLTPGANMYSKTSEDIERALAVTREFFDFFLRELGGAFIGLEELARLYGVEPGEAEALPAVNARVSF